MMIISLAVVCLLMSNLVFAQTEHTTHTATTPPAESQEEATTSIAGDLLSVADELATGNVTPERLKELAALLLSLQATPAATPETVTESQEHQHDAETGAEQEADMMCKSKMQKMEDRMKKMEAKMESMMSGSMKAKMQKMMSGQEEEQPAATTPQMPMFPMFGPVGIGHDPKMMLMQAEMMKAMAEIMLKYSAEQTEQPAPAQP